MFKIYDERNRNEVVFESEDLQEIRDWLAWDENDYSQCEDIIDIDRELEKENAGCAGYRVDWDA